MEKLEKKVILKDPEDKLYTIGFQDGKEVAEQILAKKLSQTIHLNPEGPQRYLEGYVDGVESAKRQYNSEAEKEQPKTRK